MGPKESRGSRLCFVTVGATTGFDTLVQAALTPEFLAALRAQKYTHLRVQCGLDGKRLLDTFLSENREANGMVNGISIDGFDFDKRGLLPQLKAVKGENKDLPGVVVSHAGSGSVLDSFRTGVAQIVVPNPALLDNHQVELANELASQGYLVHGKLSDLPGALNQLEELRSQLKSWPPPTSKLHDPSGMGIADIVEEEMGFLD